LDLLIINGLNEWIHKREQITNCIHNLRGLYDIYKELHGLEYKNK